MRFAPPMMATSQLPASLARSTAFSMPSVTNV